MVEVNDTAETFSTWTSLDDANLGLCLPAIEAEGRIELPVSVVGNNVESSETDDLLKWIMDDNQIADFNFPNEAEEAHKLPHRGGEGGGDKGQQEKSGQDGGVDGGGEVQEDEGAEQQGQPGLQGEEEGKLAEEEQELTTLQEKNIHLQAVFKSMQEEVALYKKRILEQVAGVRN